MHTAQQPCVHASGGLVRAGRSSRNMVRPAATTVTVDALSRWANLMWFLTLLVAPGLLGLLLIMEWLERRFAFRTLAADVAYLLRSDADPALVDVSSGLVPRDSCSYFVVRQGLWPHALLTR